MSEQASSLVALQLFLVRPGNPAGPWKADNLVALVYCKFDHYLVVLLFLKRSIAIQLNDTSPNCGGINKFKKQDKYANF